MWGFVDLCGVATGSEYSTTMCPHHPSLPRPNSGSTKGKWTMRRGNICLHIYLFVWKIYQCPLFLQDQCPEVILTTDVPFRRLDHYKIHEYTKKWNMNARREPEPVMMTMTTNIDTMFKRKRGRPPKNRVIEVSLLHNTGGIYGAERKVTFV